VIDMAKRYELQRSDVERAWANHVAAAVGEQWPQRNSCRDAIQRFLDSVGTPDPSGSPRLVIGQREILRWMIQDVAGKALSYAAERLAVLDHLLKVLVQAGLVDTDLLAEYRADHGKRSWRCLARALQAANPEAALAAIPRTSLASGPLAAYVRSYIDLHQALGKDYRAQKTALQHFDRFLYAQAIASPQAVTSALIEQWQGTLTCCAYLRVHRVRFVRRFFEYLLSLAVVMHNPVPRLLTSPRRMPHSAFKPYIFTREQLATILAAARQLPDNHVCRHRAQICVTMLTLLHALGLRHGEVRRLRLCDLQLDRRTLFIAQTKFHKSRYVPFGPKVGHCLQRYLEVRHTLVQPVRDDDPLFVTKWRKPLGFKMLLKVFRNILSTLGITGMPGQGAPRIHDLRHSFAVNRLLRWYRDGLNVQSRLPLLSTFLGHANPQSTEVYLTITADLLREANTRFHNHFGSQFDEAGHP
jgi:site-specific recombinase XerD